MLTENTCGAVHRYRSQRTSGFVCTLPADHKPVENHADGTRRRWTEPLMVVPNRRDRRRILKGLR